MAAATVATVAVFLLCTAVSAVPENFALNKQAFQSSNDGGNAALATDGNTTLQACSRTQTEDFPWWAVDFGEERQVDHLRLSTPIEFIHFQVGLTNTSPMELSPNPGTETVPSNYRTCQKVESRGNIATGTPTVHDCMGAGRYLIIQLRQRGVIALCEVGVYSEIRVQESTCFYPHGWDGTWSVSRTEEEPQFYEFNSFSKTEFSFSDSTSTRVDQLQCNEGSYQFKFFAYVLISPYNQYMSNLCGRGAIGIKRLALLHTILHTNETHMTPSICARKFQQFPTYIDVFLKYPLDFHGECMMSTGTFQTSVQQAPGARACVGDKSSSITITHFSITFSTCVPGVTFEQPLQGVEMKCVDYFDAALVGPSKGQGHVQILAMFEPTPSAYPKYYVLRYMDMMQTTGKIEMSLQGLRTSNKVRVHSLQTYNSYGVDEESFAIAFTLANFALDMVENRKVVMPGEDVTVPLPCNIQYHHNDVNKPNMYMGCARDESVRVMIESSKLVDETGMSVEKCAAHCKNKGYVVAGLEAGMECFCKVHWDDVHKPMVFMEANNCNMMCSGDASRMCGGKWALSLYLTVKTVDIVWYMASERLTLQQSPKAHLDARFSWHNASLTIRKITVSDNGRYCCYRHNNAEYVAANCTRVYLQQKCTYPRKWRGKWWTGDDTSVVYDTRRHVELRYDESNPSTKSVTVDTCKQGMVTGVKDYEYILQRYPSEALVDDTCARGLLQGIGNAMLYSQTSPVLFSCNLGNALEQISSSPYKNIAPYKNVLSPILGPGESERLNYEGKVCGMMLRTHNGRFLFDREARYPEPALYYLPEPGSSGEHNGTLETPALDYVGDACLKIMLRINGENKNANDMTIVKFIIQERWGTEVHERVSTTYHTHDSDTPTRIAFDFRTTSRREALEIMLLPPRFQGYHNTSISDIEITEGVCGRGGDLTLQECANRLKQHPPVSDVFLRTPFKFLATCGALPEGKYQATVQYTSDDLQCMNDRSSIVIIDLSGMVILTCVPGNGYNKPLHDVKLDCVEQLDPFDFGSSSRQGEAVVVAYHWREKAQFYVLRYKNELRDGGGKLLLSLQGRLDGKLQAHAQKSYRSYGTAQKSFDIAFQLQPFHACIGELCSGRGSCEAFEDSFTCHCDDGYGGFQCELELDACSGQACHGVGICYVNQDDFVCACDAGYVGKECETLLHVNCVGQTCSGHGRCVDTGQGFQCYCAPGYNGQECEFPTEAATDNCMDITCSFMGVCSSGDSGYKCDCFPGYSGADCNSGCGPGMFLCSDDQCINEDRLCNDYSDCPLAEDEEKELCVRYKIRRLDQGRDILEEQIEIKNASRPSNASPMGKMASIDAGGGLIAGVLVGAIGMVAIIALITVRINRRRKVTDMHSGELMDKPSDNGLTPVKM